MPPRMTVFVVDDDASMRRALGRLLAAAGMASIEFGSAEEMLASALPAPDCIVSDVQLPVLSGFEMMSLAKLRFGPVPVIFITAFDTPAAREEASRQPGGTFLVKPFEGSALLNAIWGATS